MIELTLLGSPLARDSSGRALGSLLAQPRRFALLAYLALESGSAHEREALATLFWPELEPVAARRNLRSALFQLREEIGEAALPSAGDDIVTVDRAALITDVARLSRAVAEGRFDDAVALDRGELLTGIERAGMSDPFVAWVLRERARVSALVTTATRALLESAELSGKAADAAHWSARACALAPDDEDLLFRAMTLHETAGDHGGALRLYDSFARRLSFRNAGTPSERSAELAARIRGPLLGIATSSSPNLVPAPTRGTTWLLAGVVAAAIAAAIAAFALRR